MNIVILRKSKLSRDNSIKNITNKEYAALLEIYANQ